LKGRINTVQLFYCKFKVWWFLLCCFLHAVLQTAVYYSEVSYHWVFTLTLESNYSLHLGHTLYTAGNRVNIGKHGIVLKSYICMWCYSMYNTHWHDIKLCIHRHTFSSFGIVYTACMLSHSSVSITYWSLWIMYRIWKSNWELQ